MNNHPTQFALFSRILHWLMAAMLVAMLFIGVAMVASVGDYHKLVAIHRPLGIAILVLVIIRLINRKLTTLPPFPPTMSQRERWVATMSERLLYTLMLALPLVGWSMLSAGHYPIVMFGRVHLPPILPVNPTLYAILRRTHTVLAYLLFVTFLAHLGAILFHTLIVRDRILDRMALWPTGSRKQMSKPSDTNPPFQSQSETNQNVMKNSKPEEFDVLVLGSGTAGKLLSWTLAKAGMKVANIERKYVGGSCQNIACLPSKNVIHSAKVASYFRRSEEFGITKENWTINMATVRERKRKMVKGLIEGHLEFYKNSGAELVWGSGRFVAPKTIEVTSDDGATRFLQGQRVIINVGTRAAVDLTPGLREAKPLTHIEALELDYVPDHLLILGGGFVGLEFAQAMRCFGSRVTVIERNPRLVHREDEDISSGIHELFHDEGIDVLTNIRITRVEGNSGKSVKLTAEREGTELVLEGTDILVTAGRTPNTEGIGLDLAGVEITSHGYIKVNERLETTASDIWAVGECAGSPQFTHISENDFHIVHDNILGGHRVTTGRQVPFCLFTDPEYARIGLSETEANKRGVAYRLAKIPLSAVQRARTLSETRGFMKALIETGSDRILGFSMFGVEAGDVLAVVQVAMLAGLPYTALRDAIFTHPTMVEGGLIGLFNNVTKA